MIDFFYLFGKEIAETTPRVVGFLLGIGLSLGAVSVWATETIYNYFRYKSIAKYKIKDGGNKV
jgi:hypothetical protein